MKHIKIVITKTGETQIEAVGFKGASCQQATAALESVLGMMSSDIKKPEFYEEEDTGQQVQQ